MRVRMLKLAAGPGGVFKRGQVYMVDGVTAEVWIAAGVAEEVGYSKPAESATVAPSETAIKPAAKPRRRSTRRKKVE